MPFFSHDQIRFHYQVRGTGTPFVFQHGLGGQAEAVLALHALPEHFQLLTMDFRAHGKTTPVGEIRKLAFDFFADDLMAFLDHLEIPRAVIGGTSMGAAVALNCALRYPARVRGLVLQRPAWLDGPRPQNVRIFATVAALLRDFGAEEGRARFQGSLEYQKLAAESSDSANSLTLLFTDPRAIETVARLEYIPQDTPARDRALWSGISVPALVLANRRDPIHPYEYGRILSEAIPGAEFHELTPKSINLARYTSEVRQHTAAFLLKHFQD